jgi:carbon storage regulator
MLVLGRKINESIVIGDDIMITVLAIDSDRVKLGIQAPRHLSILRHELYEIVKQENLRAATSAADAEQKLLPSLRSVFERQADSQADDSSPPSS